MSNLITHAKRELDLIYTDEELKEEYNKMGYDAIMELIEVFSKQGHSGFSAGYVRSAFNKLAAFEPLTPLTGEDDEWNDLGYADDAKYQNKRDSAVFKSAGGTAYYIDAIVWRDKDGVTFTNKESKLPVKFPFTPKTFYVDRYEDDSYNEKQYQEALDYYNK